MPNSNLDLSSAYSSLKFIHAELKAKYKSLQKENRDLKEQLHEQEDYRKRYDELIRMINVKELL